MGCEKVKKSVSSQEQEMQTCGQIGKEFHESVKRRNLGGSGTCEGTPHKEGQIKYDET